MSGVNTLKLSCLCDLHHWTTAAGFNGLTSPLHPTFPLDFALVLALVVCCTLTSSRYHEVHRSRFVLLAISPLQFLAQCISFVMECVNNSGWILLLHYVVVKFRSLSVKAPNIMFKLFHFSNYLRICILPTSTQLRFFDESTMYDDGVLFLWWIGIMNLTTGFHNYTQL